MKMKANVSMHRNYWGVLVFAFLYSLFKLK
jgi:hypothetical protein